MHKMMDIIFQSGEFFTESNSLWNSLISLAGVFITGGIAIFLFNRGLKKERDLNRELREERLRDKKNEEKQSLEIFRNYITSLIEGSVSESLNLIKQYKIYADKLNKEPMKQHMLELKTVSSLKSLNSIDHNELFNLFRKLGVDIKIFIDFINKSAYLFDVFEEIFKGIVEGNGKDVVIMSNKVLNLRNEILETIAVFNDNLKKTESDYSNNIFWMSLNKILMYYYENNTGHPDLNWDEEHLFKPLKDMLTDDNYLELEIRNEILGKCKIAGDTMYSIVEFNQFSANKIFISHDDITESCEDLTRINKLLVNSSIIIE